MNNELLLLVVAKTMLPFKEIGATRFPLIKLFREFYKHYRAAALSHYSILSKYSLWIPKSIDDRGDDYMCPDEHLTCVESLISSTTFTFRSIYSTIDPHQHERKESIKLFLDTLVKDFYSVVIPHLTIGNNQDSSYPTSCFLDITHKNNLNEIEERGEELQNIVIKNFKEKLRGEELLVDFKAERVLLDTLKETCDTYVTSSLRWPHQIDFYKKYIKDNSRGVCNGNLLEANYFIPRFSYDDKKMHGLYCFAQKGKDIGLKEPLIDLKANTITFTFEPFKYE